MAHRTQRIFRENAVFIMISLAAFLTEPALAQTQPPYAPINFTEPLKLSRGSLTPQSQIGSYLEGEERCRFVTVEYGWSDCLGIDALIFDATAEIGVLLVREPTDDGYVRFDDWDKDDRDEEIEGIWDALVEGLKAQGEKLGVEIKPIGWAVYPTLDKQNSYMFYAHILEWDGQRQISVESSLFDRYGYTSIQFVPNSNDLTEAQLRALVEATLRSYRPDQQTAYVDFADGDKVAAVGALGVLATLVGVKYGKGVFATIVAVGLLILKKAWFLVLAPLLFFGRLFRRRSGGGEG